VQDNMVAPPDNDVLWARGLRHSHHGSPALLGVSIGARVGEILGVLGTHGSGKTTLLRCLSGELLPDEGEIWFNSAPVHTLPTAARERLRRDRFGWIGSTPQLIPELTARENVALPLLLCGLSHRKAKNAAQEWLARLDIGSLARKRPAELLQAQRQRVAIARALVTGPSVVFADEPTAPLHRADRGQVLRILTSAARSHGITVLLASTDSEVVALADRVISLVDGRPVAGMPAPTQDRESEGSPSCSASV
jgi:putative ABC transport system ATP-binding protein